MGDEKRCPVMYGRYSLAGPRTISMALAERAYSVYSGRYGTSQPLTWIVARGGFGDTELDAFVPGWRDEESDLTRLRATIARVREICAGDHDAAYDLRADILAEIGGES